MQSRRRELSDLTLPLFHFEPEEVDIVCNLYIAASNSCYTETLMRNCRRSNPLVRYVESNLAYSCKVDNEPFFKKFLCISDTVRANRHCSKFNRPLLMPGKDDKRCANIPDWYICLRDKILDGCGVAGLEVFDESLDNFGCADSINRIVRKYNVDRDIHQLRRLFDTWIGYFSKWSCR